MSVYDIEPQPEPQGAILAPPSPEKGIDGANSPEADLLEQLVSTSLRLRRWGLDLESATGLSGRELDLVSILCRSGPTSVKSLVADLGLPRSTMTAIVDRLEERELVRRTPNPEDRRSVILAATPKATEALRRYREGMQDALRRIDRILSREERLELTRLIGRVADAL